MFQAEGLQFGGTNIIMNSSRVWKMPWQCYGRNKSWVAELILEIRWSQWSALTGGCSIFLYELVIQVWPQEKGLRYKVYYPHRSWRQEAHTMPRRDTWRRLLSIFRKQKTGPRKKLWMKVFFSYWSFVGKAREEKVNCLGLAKFESLSKTGDP